jgi:3-oxoacyl-[acyl-carrier protein] reductase
MDLELESKRALVVAASSGLGYAAAKALVREGAKVIVCSSSQSRIQSAADALGPDVIPFAADISNPEDVRNLAREVGGIDILVTNAGGPPAGAFSDLSAAQWKAGIDGVLNSVLELCRCFLPGMAEREWGRVIMITSVAARHPMDGLIVSNTVRAGLLGLIRTLSREYGPHNVLINAVLPGFTATGRLLELAEERASKTGVGKEEIRRSWEREIPLGRIAEPGELGDVVAFLCSERASYITGTALAVDGGYARGLP